MGTGGLPPEGIELIDLHLGGRPQTLAAYVVLAEETALIDTGPNATFAVLREALRTLGIGPERLRHVVLTHTHIDHAGAVREMCDEFPSATVWVHPSGSRHLVDPAERVLLAAWYGEEQAQRVFGSMGGISASRLQTLRPGQIIELGNRRLEVLFTPGHADDHISLVDRESRAVFVGEALGIYFAEVGLVRPSMPPPEADVERALESIALVGSQRADVLLLSHFGAVREVERLCSMAASRLQGWSDVVRQVIDRKGPDGR